MESSTFNFCRTGDMFVVDFGSNLFEALDIEKMKKITFNLKIDIYFGFSDNNCFDCLSCSTNDTNYQNWYGLNTAQMKEKIQK